MKNLLSMIALSGGCLAMSAQVLDQDNFNTYTVGNMSTATDYLTPVTSTQGGYTLSASNTAANIGIDASSFAIAAGSTTGVSTNATNVLKMKGPGLSPSPFPVAKSSLSRGNAATAWAARTAGNNTIVLELDLFGKTNTSSDKLELEVLGTYANISNQVAALISYQDLQVSGGPKIGGNSIVALFGSMPDNQWSKLKLKLDTNSGICLVYLNDAQVGQITLSSDPNKGAYTLNAITVNTVFQAFTSMATTTAEDFFIDNVVVTATSEAILTTKILEEKTKAVVTTLEVSPNPSSDVVNISSPSALINADVYNSAGQLLITSSNNSIDVSGLNKGTYTFKIVTKDGTYNRQVIKN
jgi:Secretion system C-terminal sorting domain